MLKQLPIGMSDYKKVIEGNYYYVDKTLFIKELVETSGEVILIPRPRRFGKTLNLSMLRYFFEKPLDGQDTSVFFANTAIWQDEKYRAMQGQYPVIFLTFKDVKEPNWQKAYEKIVTLISIECKRYEVFFETHKEKIGESNFNQFRQLVEKKGTQTDVEFSLKFLTEMLERITNERAIVLLDEYDTPINWAYTNGYYSEMTGLIRSLFTPVLKDNAFLKRGVLTGILRTAKEGIFSGLNNLKVCTLLNENFSQYFGLLQSEVDTLLQDYQLIDKRDEVKNWYNGYQVGENTTIYNPWSLINFVDEKGNFQPYWVNTSDNALIAKILIRSTNEVKIELENILNNIPVIKEIDEAMIFPGIEQNERAIWSLLFFSGYLTYSEKTLTKGANICTLCIPNAEIEILYEKLLTSFFNESLDASALKDLLAAMIGGDVETFSDTLQEFVLDSMSSHDLPDTEPEKSYHLFVLGLLVLLTNQYRVISNRESGRGRYDIMLVPHDKTKTGLVIEFKKIKHKDDKTAPSSDHFEKNCQEALDQIKEKKYAHELRAQGVTNIIAYGIAFFKKELLITMERL